MYLREWRIKRPERRGPGTGKGSASSLRAGGPLRGYALVPFPVAAVDVNSMVATGRRHRRFNTIRGEASRLTLKLDAVPPSVGDSAETLFNTVLEMQGVPPRTRGAGTQRLPLVPQGFALLHSLPGGHAQVLHRDISPVELNRRAALGQRLDMSVVVALEDDVRLHVLPGSHVLSHADWHAAGQGEAPVQVHIPRGQALLFLSSLVHGGAAYRTPNTRLHFCIPLGLSLGNPTILEAQGQEGLAAASFDGTHSARRKKIALRRKMGVCPRKHQVRGQNPASTWHSPWLWSHIRRQEKKQGGCPCPKYRAGGVRHCSCRTEQRKLAPSKL